MNLLFLGEVRCTSFPVVCGTDERSGFLVEIRSGGLR